MGVPDPRLTKLKRGIALPEVRKTVTPERIVLYAQASGDFNPIHVDEDFAGRTQFGGIIAHGMLILAYVSEMMTDAFGKDWLAGGHLDVRFKNPVRPGDTLTTSGRICSIAKGKAKTVVGCDVYCQNQNGQSVIIGRARVKLFQKD